MKSKNHHTRRIRRQHLSSQTLFTTEGGRVRELAGDNTVIIHFMFEAGCGKVLIILRIEVLFLNLLKHPTFPTLCHVNNCCVFLQNMKTFRARNWISTSATYWQTDFEKVITWNMFWVLLMILLLFLFLLGVFTIGSEILNSFKAGIGISVIAQHYHNG